MKHAPIIAINIIKKYLSHLPKEHVEIILNWSHIVGDYKDSATPYKLKFTKNKLNKDIKTLVINCNSSSLVYSLHFSKEVIIQRINNYFGYKAIDDIDFVVM